MEYSYDFRDNIRTREFNTRAEGIATWIEENKEKEEWAKDPNAYELANVFLFAGKYRQERVGNVDMNNIDKMWSLRANDFERCGISADDYVYMICQDSYESARDERALVNDEHSHHALRKMAGLGLYLAQQQRDKGSVEYNNVDELVELIATSKTLKNLHPDLYQRYDFEQNIDRLLSLQLQQQIHPDVKSRLVSYKEEMLGTKQQMQQTKQIEEDIER